MRVWVSWASCGTWPRWAWLALAIGAGLLVAPWYLRYALFAAGMSGTEFLLPRMP